MLDPRDVAKDYTCSEITPSLQSALPMCANIFSLSRHLPTITQPITAPAFPQEPDEPASPPAAPQPATRAHGPRRHAAPSRGAGSRPAAPGVPVSRGLLPVLHRPSAYVADDTKTPGIRRWPLQ